MNIMALHHRRSRPSGALIIPLTIRALAIVALGGALLTNFTIATRLPKRMLDGIFISRFGLKKK